MLIRYCRRVACQQFQVYVWTISIAPKGHDMNVLKAIFATTLAGIALLALAAYLTAVPLRAGECTDLCTASDWAVLGGFIGLLLGFSIGIWSTVAEAIGMLKSMWQFALSGAIAGAAFVGMVLFLTGNSLREPMLVVFAIIGYLIGTVYSLTRGKSPLLSK
jgi:hypothetical protein